MICSRKDYMDYVRQDALASRRLSVKAKLFGDYVWKWHLLLRKCEYEANCWRDRQHIFLFPIKSFHQYRFKKLSVKLGFYIPLNVFDAGFSIAHYGTIIVNGNSRVGKNCRCQTGVCLGATNGTDDAPVIGDNVFLGEGCKLIGGIHVADDVAIGANAVVTKDITEPGTTWGGIPAKKISDKNSHSNLSKALFDSGETQPVPHPSNNC